MIAIFMELDWGDEEFSEKKAECAKKVQTVRMALQGRATKLAVVLLQKQVLQIEILSCAVVTL